MNDMMNDTARPCSLRCVDKVVVRLQYIFFVCVCDCTKLYPLLILLPYISLLGQNAIYNTELF
jgi:hypothetical protein